MQALGAQRRDEPAVELRPRPHAVGSLDDERPHPGGVRVRGDRRYPAPVGPAQVPDPHGPSVGRPRRGPGRRETEPEHEHERRGHQPKAQGHVVDASPTRRRFEDRQGRLQRLVPLPAAVAAEPRGLDRHARAAARLLTPGDHRVALRGAGRDLKPSANPIRYGSLCRCPNRVGSPDVDPPQAACAGARGQDVGAYCV